MTGIMSQTIVAGRRETNKIVIGLILIVLFTTTAESKCYSIWHYKHPQQHCRATALARPMRLPSTRIAIVVPIPRTREEMDIPLPGLAFTPAAEPDALTRLKLFLLMKGREQ